MPRSDGPGHVQNGESVLPVRPFSLRREQCVRKRCGYNGRMDPEEPIPEDAEALDLEAFGIPVDPQEELPEFVSIAQCSGKAPPWPSCVFYNSLDPWVNPAMLGGWPGSGFANPAGDPFYGLIEDDLFAMPNGMPPIIRPWVTGRDYRKGSLVRLADDMTKVWVRTGEGSGTSQPSTEGSTTPWQAVSGAHAIEYWLFGVEHPGEFVDIPYAQAMLPATAGLPGVGDLVVLQATLSGTFGTSYAVSGPLQRHTWSPCAAIGTPRDYIGRIEDSIVSASNVSSGARTITDFPSGTNGADGFILENRAQLVFQLEPYFSMLGSLMLTDEPGLEYLADNLDAHVLNFYGGSGTTTTLWQPDDPERADVRRFPLGASSTGVYKTATSVTAKKADSNDATAGLFAMGAVRYYRYGESNGLVWMEENYQAVFDALLHNVVMRRRGINHTAAYGTAHSIPTTGSGKRAGRIRTWRAQAYNEHELVWNPDPVFDLGSGLRRTRFRRLAGSGTTLQPGVGSWSSDWVATGGEAMPGGFLTQTFQLHDDDVFLYTLDTIEAFAGYRAVWQLWTLAAWSSAQPYRRCDAVHATWGGSSGYFECMSPHESAIGNHPFHPTGGGVWRRLPNDHFPEGTSAEAIFTEGAAMRAKAEELAEWVHPSDLLDGIRIMFKHDEADVNSVGDSHWFSSGYSVDSMLDVVEFHEVSGFTKWVSDFLVLPFAVIYDAYLDDDYDTHKSLIETALELFEEKAPHCWWSRNYVFFADQSRMAAMYARLGMETKAKQARDFVRMHHIHEDKANNPDEMWLELVHKYLCNPETGSDPGYGFR